MTEEYERILEKAAERSAFIQRQMKYLGKFNIKNFDHVVADFHAEAFAAIDCMKCGNCCRAVGPAFSETDVKRVVKAIGAEPKAFARQYLEKDEEFGWVCKTLPCLFLGEDNACSVYDVRPRSCEAYPYTDERNVQRSLGRLARNAGFCPAAYVVAEKIIERYAKGTDA